MTTTRGVLRTAAIAGPALALAVHAAPVVSTFGPLRNRTMRRLAAVGTADHVALTFDDGPDPASTPRFVELLAERDVRATFFLLGFMAERAPGLVAEIVAAGHEVGVHGWRHRNLLLRGPRATYDDLARARDYRGELVGTAPRLFRPPYGVMTASAHSAAARLDLTPTLWTAWGEDWTARATPASVFGEVRRDLRGGGTILLHDSDCTAKPDSWKSALGALPFILDHCGARGWTVGPLREHFAAPAAPAVPAASAACGAPTAR